MQIQCRISDEERRGQLIHALAARIQSEFGVTAAIDLLPPHSIPRTSSGKPARAEAKNVIRRLMLPVLMCRNPGMNQTVAVTGATGFIGKYIIDNLLARGFHVRALTRTARAHVNDNLTWVRGSLEDTHSLSELVAGASVVVHCAGQVRGHKEEIFTRCNVDGSLRLMQAAKRAAFANVFCLSLRWRRAIPSSPGMQIQIRRRATTGSNGGRNYAGRFSPDSRVWSRR